MTAHIICSDCFPMNYKPTTQVDTAVWEARARQSYLVSVFTSTYNHLAINTPHNINSCEHDSISPFKCQCLWLITHLKQLLTTCSMRGLGTCQTSIWPLLEWPWPLEHDTVFNMFHNFSLQYTYMLMSEVMKVY